MNIFIALRSAIFFAIPMGIMIPMGMAKKIAERRAIKIFMMVSIKAKPRCVLGGALDLARSWVPILSRGCRDGQDERDAKPGLGIPLILTITTPTG